jgi:DNA-binding NtrC family response regulator
MDRSTPPGTSSETNLDGSRSWPWVSTAMCALEDDIACAIQSDETVMITGEGGAGRKYVAHLIHTRSRRGSAPFVIASCPDVVESLHQSSSLDGGLALDPADQLTHGPLKTASNGTLLIEEIETITVPMQAQLMRLLEQQVTGGSNVRFVSATSTTFFERVRSSQFSEDLFYRLNVIHLTIPALRERPEDILILMRHFLSFYSGAKAPRLSIGAWRRILAYSWPGNVPELKAVAEKLAAQGLRRLVEPDDLPHEIGQ